MTDGVERPKGGGKTPNGETREGWGETGREHGGEEGVGCGMWGRRWCIGCNRRRKRVEDDVVKMQKHFRQSRDLIIIS